MDDKQKKTLIILGSVLVVLVVTTAILMLTRKKVPDGTTQPTTSIDGQVTLNYWGLWEPNSVMQPVIDEFETLYPNIKIAYSQQTFSNYESKLYTRLQQATGSSEPAPDIFRIHNTWTPKYYSLLSPLPGSVMTRDEYSQIFYPTSLADFTAKDGNLYAIPWSIDGLMVYYNKQLLSEVGVSKPPSDWDSFFEVARELTEKDSSGRITQSGLAIGTSRNIKHSAEILSFLLLQENISLMDETRTSISLNNTAVEGVFETYTNYALGDDAIWSATLDNDLEMFFAGKLAMMIAPSWRAFEIIESAPTIEFDTAPLPQLSANEDRIYYATYWGDAVNKNSSNTQAAWTFVKFLSEKEQQLTLYSNSSQIRAFGEPYSLVELNSEMLNRPYVSAIAEMAPYMQAWPMGDEFFIRDALDNAITKIVEDGDKIPPTLRNTESTINAKIEQTNK